VVVCVSTVVVAVVVTVMIFGFGIRF
jgi:hypothetical protein